MYFVVKVTKLGVQVFAGPVSEEVAEELRNEFAKQAFEDGVTGTTFEVALDRRTELLK